MKIFHSSLPLEVIKKYQKIYPQYKPNILISFGYNTKDYMSNYKKYSCTVNNVMLDSGTFTLNSNIDKYKGKINFNNYLDFLWHNSDKFNYYFNFDADYSDCGSTQNLGHQKMLERYGLNPIPVIHNCVTEIDFYINQGYKFIAIGSSELKYKSNDELKMHLRKLYSKNIKVHFLGNTEYKKLSLLPVYSADSSTLIFKGCKGYIAYWNPNKKGYNKTDEIDFLTNEYNRDYYRSYSDLNKLEDYLWNDLSLDIKDLEGKHNKINRHIVNLHYFKLLERIIHKNQVSCLGACNLIS